jgi:phospholipase/carboxylesterase
MGFQSRREPPLHHQHVYRFAPTPEHRAERLFVFLHGAGADAHSLIPAAFKFQARFPSAALVLPEGIRRCEADATRQQWFSNRGLNDDNRLARVKQILPDVEYLVRREQATHRVDAERTVLIGFSQGGTVALEAIKAFPGLANAVVAFSARFARLPETGSHIPARIHLVHGEYDAIVSRVHSERAARVLSALHVPCTLDVIGDLGHALSHHAISIGSLRLLQGIFERRRATLH